MKKKIVIKLGGSSLDQSATLHELTLLLRHYRQQNFSVILVHGGGPAINRALVEQGIPWTFINGQRQTTPEMMFVIERVLATEVNSAIVASLRANGISAQGLSGASDGILFCVPAAPELLQVGEVVRVDTLAINAVLALDNEPTPVIAPIGTGLSEASLGERFNVNADWAACQIAIALNAERLVFLTDQNGVLDADRTPLSTVTPRVLERMIESGVISGGMRTKVTAMLKALNSGVARVQVLNAASAGQLVSIKNLGTLLQFDQETIEA